VEGHAAPPPSCGVNIVDDQSGPGVEGRCDGLLSSSSTHLQEKYLEVNVATLKEKLSSVNVALDGVNQELILEHGRRRVAEVYLDTMKREVASLLEKVDLLTKDRRYTEEDFGRAVDDKVAEAMSNFVAISVAKHTVELEKAFVAAARFHEAQLADVVAKLEEKCKEVKHLEEKLHNLEAIEDGVNEDDGFPSSRNDDGGNVELASEGLYVAAPLTCIAEEGGSTRRVRGKKRPND
jgi:hypothetical protein